ncbi:MAG: haloacid dehalogenase type II [Hyphomicrobiaceae bacterium]|nr:haloacid dehalogenase type II [Hyphomicrobiaceae bacterium]
MSLEEVKALHFDVFGTVVDWRSSIIAELETFGERKGITADWTQFADDWRGMYQPSMDAVRRGDREWRPLDILHRESLITLISRHNISGLTEEEIDHLNKAWHRLNPWPDCVEGLTRLRKKYILATLSNGNVALLVNMARHGGLPWDAILGAEVNRAYKPLPQCYRGNARYLDLDPSQCMLVAAHNDDLAAARTLGYRTAFICRPTEYGSNQTNDTKAESDWDIVTISMTGVADALGC